MIVEREKMQKEIELSGEKFRYTVERKRVKNLNLRINKNGEIVVSCHRFVPLYEIEDFIKNNEKFIRKNLLKISEYKEKAEKKKEYVSNEEFIIFGESKRLCVLPGRRNTAFLKDDKINLLLIDINDKEKAKSAIRRLEDRLAKEKISSFVDFYFPYFSSYTKGRPEVTFRRTISQWGSCTPSKNKMSFNLNLIYLSDECIRYVVVHEYCHFIELNHSQQFYKSVSRFIPDYKEIKKRINEEGKYQLKK